MKHNPYNQTLQMSSKTVEDSYIDEGNLLIPDISGFTRFVQNTDMEIGKHIISRLLTVLLNTNVLNMDVSEIEGDAILFYKLGKRFSATEVMTQFNMMQKRFRTELLQLAQETGLDLKLSLKMIAHYGQLSQYRVGRFTKLYGTSVIEAHRLLKNSIESDEYLIITDNLSNNELLLNNRIGFANRVCETYSQIDPICFTWL